MNEIIIKRVAKLSKAKGEKPTVSMEKSGVGKNFFGNLRNNATTSTEKIKKLAIYFNVTTDYLLGITDNPFPPELHNAKLAFYESMFAGLDEDDIDTLKQVAQRLRDKGNM